MSVPSVPPPSPKPPRWDPFVTGLMILLGIPLLAPGFCVWMGAKLGSGDLVAMALLFCLPGMALLVSGIRRLAVPPTRTPTHEAVKGVSLLLLLVAVVVTLGWVLQIFGKLRN